jgi:hypothetical protein
MMYSYDDNNGYMNGEASHTEELFLVFRNRDCFIFLNVNLNVNGIFVCQFNIHILFSI